MKINEITIKYYSKSSLIYHSEFPTHTKSLPFLSIVQATEGNYDFALNESKYISIPEGGAFVAPKNKMQFIKHIPNPHSKKICCQWIFVEAIINKMYSFDDIYDTPIVFPEQFNNELERLIGRIDYRNIFIDYECIYRILEILAAFSTPHDPGEHSVALKIRNYLSESFQSNITPQTLCEKFRISSATLYRLFQNEFGESPCNYINDLRLKWACVLLEKTTHPIKQISFDTGFNDEFYFSKLFKKKFSVSPTEYRKSYKSGFAKSDDS